MAVGFGLVGRRTAEKHGTSQALQPPHGVLQGAVRQEIDSTRAGTVGGPAGAPGSSGPCPDPGPRVSRCVVCFQAWCMCFLRVDVSELRCCPFCSSFAAPKWWPRAWRSGYVSGHLKAAGKGQRSVGQNVALSGTRAVVTGCQPAKICCKAASAAARES